MSFRSRILAVALFALVTFPVAASAQDAAPAKLTIGTWTGIVMPPDGTLEVTYDVSYKGDTLAIVLNAGGHGQFTLNEVEHSASKLTFSFTPGPRVVCALKPNDDGTFGGQCTDDGGASVPMTMVPPARDAKAPGSSD